MFLFGIEHEVALLRADGSFADWHNTTAAELERIIARLPAHPDDHLVLFQGDQGIRQKRWYLEGAERFDEQGRLIHFDPKGIEVRTRPHPTILGAVAELQESLDALQSAARALGFVPITIAHHPYRISYVYDPPLNGYERQLRSDQPMYLTEHLPMVTYGPDFNLSRADFSTEQAVDLARKLTFYSPILCAFLLNAPVYQGARWEGLSVRTAHRNGVRPAVRVYVGSAAELVPTLPPLVLPARTATEIGRIEFKACDSCPDLSLYAGLLSLLKGLALDDTLPGRSSAPDAARHRHVARTGFSDADTVQQAEALLAAARAALLRDADGALLQPLEDKLARRTTPAHELLRRLDALGSLERLLPSLALPAAAPRGADVEQAPGSALPCSTSPD